MRDAGLIATMKRRRHIKIRLTRVVVKELPVKGLVLGWIRMQLLVWTWAAGFGIP